MLDLDPIHRSDLHSGGVDFVSRRETAGVGEHRAVPDTRFQELQILILERCQYDAAVTINPTTPTRTAWLCAISLIVVRTFRSSDSPVDSERRTVGTVDLQCDSAQIEVEERPVRADSDQLLVVRGHGRENPIELTLLLDQRIQACVQLRQVSRDVRANSGEEIGEGADAVFTLSTQSRSSPGPPRAR